MRVHLKSQVISTSFDLVLALDDKLATPCDKVFGFLGKSKTLHYDMQGSLSSFIQGNQANKCAKMSRKMPKKKELEKNENRPKTGNQKGQKS